MEFDTDAGGYAMRTKFDELGLTQGLRLIEDGTIQYVHLLKDVRLQVELTSFDANVNFGLNLACPLFNIRGLRLESVHLDCMHIFSLGVSQWLVGSVFKLLVSKNFCKAGYSRQPSNALAICSTCGDV
eukprot:3807171-Pyramimonas_sp.AAC.1